MLVPSGELRLSHPTLLKASKHTMSPSSEHGWRRFLARQLAPIAVFPANNVHNLVGSCDRKLRHAGGASDCPTATWSAR